jgi:hypothetical protein
MSGKILREILEADKLIRSYGEQIRELKEMRDDTGRVSSVIRYGKTTVKSDRTGNLASKIVDLEEVFIKNIEYLIELKTKVYKAISMVENERDRILLTERYINLKKPMNIADDNHYSWEYVRKLLPQASKLVEGYLQAM